jgi:hypothetical protein
MKAPPEFDHEWVRPLIGHAAQHGLLSESSLYFSMRKHASLRHYFEDTRGRTTFVESKEHLSP